MKTKSLKISKPCQENWDKMLSNNDGRFCNLCEKSVIDFTGLNQKEISNTIKKSKGSICAKVTASQLKMPFLDITEQTNYRLPYSKAAASVMLIASIASAQSCDSKDTKASTEISMNQNPSEGVKIVNNKESKISKPKNNIKFSGKVITLDNKVLENAKIIVVTLGKLYITYSKSDGGFSIQIPKDIINDSNVVRFEYDDIKRINKDKNSYNMPYMAENLILKKAEITSEYQVTPTEDYTEMGDIAIQVPEENPGNPIVINDGVKVSFEEFRKAQQGKKSTCNIKNKGFIYFEPQTAIALYGEKAKYGLYLFSKDVKKH